jgi:LCP family protein required for cell wall assembly
MKKRTLAILLGVAGVVVVGIIGGVLYLRQHWTEALAAPLELPTYTPTFLAESPTVPLGTEQPTEGPTETSTSTPGSAPLCGGPERMRILAIGADNRTDSYLYGLADVVRLVDVDFVTPRVSVLSLPRDLWVEIPDIVEERGLTHGRLNQAYTYGNPGVGYYSGPGAGPGLLARTLDYNFGWRADHYVAVNMLTFVDIVDAVGGIDIYLPEAVDGRPVDSKGSDFGYYEAGWHHFDGETALKFSRIRKRDSDFMRQSRQNQVICALKEKVLSPSVIGDIPQLLLAFRGRVLTDLSLAQMTQLACLATKLSKENLVFASLPLDLIRGGYTETGAYVVFADADDVRALIADFEAGVWPTESSSQTCE